MELFKKIVEGFKVLLAFIQRIKALLGLPTKEFDFGF